MGVRGVKRHIKEILITSLSHHSQPSKDTLTITITMPKVSSVYINTVHHFHSILPRVGMLCFCKTLHASRETRQGYLRAVRFGSPSPRAPHRRWRYSRRPLMRHQRRPVVRSSRRQTCVVGVFVNTISRDTPDQWLALNGRVLLSVLCCVTRLCDTCVDCTFFGFPGHERAEFSPISYGTVCLHVAFVFVCLFV